ncbi:hypothetical protein K504DRAFT_141549 [Pleomassaria siparia CBS 279.74]|uniref:Uncharacterized protein n=1 Tax=Pleomassaria siparia CBS 279.74 TaxID=1314801 RepID=A0A6G1KLB3_9PLEO|nr:hypothetical protein K504DRAFT_141549 [Pleomassaria siparia CBS 279.74]
MPFQRLYFYVHDAVKCSLCCRRACGPTRRALGLSYLRGGEGAKRCGSGSLRVNSHPFTCHCPSWGVVRIKSMVAHCVGQACATGGRTGLGEGRYLSMVAMIALFVVLDRLGVEHAAVCASRRCTGGLFLDLVSTAVDVYDLGAHAGDDGRGRGGRGAGVRGGGREGGREGDGAGQLEGAVELIGSGGWRLAIGNVFRRTRGGEEEGRGRESCRRIADASGGFASQARGQWNDDEGEGENAEDET